MNGWRSENKENNDKEKFCSATEECQWNFKISNFDKYNETYINISSSSIVVVKVAVVAL